jgi:dephospho-CoA kinase
MLLEEVVMGCFLIVPLAIIIGHLTIRLAIHGGGGGRSRYYYRQYLRLYMRPDVWTTLVIAVVGDLLLEFLIPSLQCLPLLPEEAAAAVLLGTDAVSALQHAHRLRPFITSRTATEMSYGTWLQHTWGFNCPQPPCSYCDNDENDDSHSHSSPSPNDYFDTYNAEFYYLRQRTVAVLLGIRLAFLCLGVYIGESFVPVAFTGGIACGKSTVAQLLLHRHPDHNATTTTTTTTATTTTTGGGSSTRGATAEEVDREGTFCIIDADSIAHEILLPPHVLATNPPSSLALPEFSNKRHWTVQPHESVYRAVLNAFSAADFNNNNSNQEVDDDGDDNDSASLGGGGGGSVVAVGKQEDGDNSSKRRGSKKDTLGSRHDTTKQQHPPQQQHHFLLDEHGLIDRTKLGTIVFHNAAARRRLGAITHPQIFLVMMKRILHCIYFLPFSSWLQYPTFSLMLLVQYFWPFHTKKASRNKTNQHLRHQHRHNDDDDDVSNDSGGGSIATSTDVVCVDVPLLFESGQLCWLFALVICVATEKEDLILQRLQKRNPDWTREHCRARIASQMPLTEKMRRADYVILNNTNSLADLQENVERVRMQVVQRIYGILGLTLMQMLILVSASLISILLFSPTPSSS